MGDDNDSEEDVNNLHRLLAFKLDMINTLSVKSTAGSCLGDNYMSIVRRSLLTGLDRRKQVKTVSLIIKRQIPSRSRRMLYRCDEAFLNEITAYGEVVPMLERHMPSGSLLPKCYYGGTDDTGDVLILEDLTVSGFRMRNRLLYLDYEHCELIVKELAKLHAASIGAMRTNMSTFKTKKDCLKDIVYSPEAGLFYGNVVWSSFSEALKSLTHFNNDGTLTEAIRLMELLQPVIFKHMQNLVNNKDGINTLVCHGDLWINNIMFKTDEEDKPVAVKFLDLQAMRYSSPVFDLLHLIYSSTKVTTRRMHLDQILETYCTSIRSLIEQQDIPNSYANLQTMLDSFTLPRIKQEFEENILYGFAIAVWILPAITFDPKNLPNLDLLSETNQDGKDLSCTKKLTPEYHSRLRDLVLEFTDHGYLTVPYSSD